MVQPKRTYLDYNASAPVLDCARNAMIASFDECGNASSVHFEGRAGKKTVEAARVKVAELIEAKRGNIIFTSGATEAAHHALAPIVRGGGNDITLSRLYISATEHPCVLAGGRFQKEDVTVLPVLESGIIDVEHLTSVLKDHDHSQGLPMVALQAANSETGIIQPLRAVADLVHAHDGLFVVDAVQALGKTPIRLEETGADFLLLSGHKIGGPQGVGALVLADGSLSPKPLFSGGGQENYHRSGTENIAAIAGFGAACEWHRENLIENIHKYAVRDSIEDGISTISLNAGNSVSQPVFFGKAEKRLANTSLFSVPGIKAETALMALDLEGIAVSSGSACSSGKVKQSHVLEAMGATHEEMVGAVRISIGWNSTPEEAIHFLDAWKIIIGRMAA